MSPTLSRTEAETRAVAAAAAGLLDQGRRLHDVSRLLTAGAGLGLIAGMILAPSGVLAAGLGLTMLLGLAETYLAIRVGFDAALFARLSERPASVPGLDSLDGALNALGLIDAGKAGRPVDVRAAGALRLLTWQGGALAGQAAVLIAGGLAAGRLS